MQPKNSDATAFLKFSESKKKTKAGQRPNQNRYGVKMNQYESRNFNWTTEVGKAAAQFLSQAAAMIPVVVVALGAGVIISNVLSAPFAFSCKAVPVEQVLQPVKRRHAESVRYAVEATPAPYTKIEAEPLKVEPVKPKIGPQ